MIASEQDARAFIEGLGSGQAVSKLEWLASELAAENERQNLVAPRSLENVWQRHFADSAQLTRHVPRETKTWLDMGSGAGFPGIILATLWPTCELVLVESRRKRIEWLQHVRSELGLTNVRIEGKRLELVAPFAADTITARAFAPLPKLLELSTRFSAAETTWVLPKGRSASQELTDTSETWNLAFHVEQSLTDPASAILVGQGKPERRTRR